LDYVPDLAPLYTLRARKSRLPQRESRLVERAGTLTTVLQNKHIHRKSMNMPICKNSVLETDEIVKCKIEGNDLVIIVPQRSILVNATPFYINGLDSANAKVHIRGERGNKLVRMEIFLDCELMEPAFESEF
jgi:hypothetical protein